jgi:hypothetical protein
MGDYLRCSDLTHLPAALIERYEAGNAERLLNVEPRPVPVIPA